YLEKVSYDNRVCFTGFNSRVHFLSARVFKGTAPTFVLRKLSYIQFHHPSQPLLLHWEYDISPAWNSLYCQQRLSKNKQTYDI
ncbi:MAG: hypothetical protein PHF87_09410, partial [Desulfotomaculaceae bacterium]|nr:hypothetical protein [Desulfotomaculaceae bacterium]